MRPKKREPHQPNRYKVIKLGVELGEGGKRLSIHEITELLNVGERTAYRYVAILRVDFEAPIILLREKSKNVYVCSRSWSMVGALKAA